MKFSGKKDDICELTYNFEKPVLIRGYIIETADNGVDSDPKNWKIFCRDIDADDDKDIEIDEI